MTWTSAATITTAAAVKQYLLTYPILSKQAVHELKKACLKEKEATNKEVTDVKSRKRGRSKLMPDNIMAQTIQIIQNYPQALRLKGAPVSSAVINDIAKGVVMAEDRCLLTECGDHVAFSDQ